MAGHLSDAVSKALLLACALTFATAFVVPGAQACTRAVLPNSGETPSQAWDRAARAEQDRALQTADVVFLADVVAMKRDGNRFHAIVAPRAPVKGDLPLDPIGYEIDTTSIACGDWDFPDMSGAGVFYMNEATVQGMVSPAHLQDGALKERLIRMDGEIITPPDVRTPLEPSWTWLALCSAATLVLGGLAGSGLTRRAYKLDRDRTR